MKINLTLITLIATSTLVGCASIKDIFTSKIPEITLQETLPPIFEKTGPTAKANLKYRHVTVGEIMNINASSSINRQIGDLNYRWEFISRPAGSQATVNTTGNPEIQITIDQPGTYELRIHVTDKTGASDYFDIKLSTQSSDLPGTSFIAMGDFGTGDVGQYRVAKGIEKLCHSERCDFVIGLGDNFYQAGVEAVADRQFQDKFEKPYQNINLPFYMVLGNHDTTSISDGDGIYNMRGDIQIAYSKSPQKPSYRFQLPARYYRISAPIDQPEQQPLVDLYALDTTLLTSPKDVIPRYDLHPMYDRESRWISHEKESSQAEWQIAFGHHPYISKGTHGDAGNFDNVTKLGDKEILNRIAGLYVKQFIEEQVCGDIDLYISGHEHNLQYLLPVPGCEKTEFIVSGAGAKANNFDGGSAHPVYWQAEKKTGFFKIDIIGNQMTVKAYTVDEGSEVAVEQYRRTLEKP